MPELRYVGDLPKIEEAVRQMVKNLVAGKAHKDILAEWDYARGNAWFRDIPS